VSGILSPITDILAKLSSLNYANNAGQTPNLYARVWNGQVKQLQRGENYPYPLPAAFLEVVLPDDYSQLAEGITECDITFRIHLVDEELDAGDGTMDQNLVIFALRDAVIKLLTYYQPIACSNLQKVSEQQDYDHTNVYHYIIDFKCSFIDDRGDQRQALTTTGPPTVLDIASTLGPLEIYNVSYTGSVLTINYRLFYSQDVQFIITGGPTLDAGVLPYGIGQFNSITLSLSPGGYFVTGTAVASSYTTPNFEFIVP